MEAVTHVERLKNYILSMGGMEARRKLPISLNNNPSNYPLKALSFDISVMDRRDEADTVKHPPGWTSHDTDQFSVYLPSEEHRPQEGLDASQNR